MDPKKNNVFSKLRDKTKPLFNVKVGKKAKKTPLKYRRSISVPDLRCDQSMPSLLDSTVQSSFPDSFVGPMPVLVHDETKYETSSLTDSLTATDTTLSAKTTDSYAVPESPFSKRFLGLYSASVTPLDQIITPNTVRNLDQFTPPYTPPASTCSASERPAFISVPATKDKPDKRMEDREKNTIWYIEDSESACSTPSEDRSYIWPPEHELTVLEPFTPRSTEMFIIGSAEDKNEVSWGVLK